MDDAISLGVADYLANPDQPVVPRLRDSLLSGVQKKPDYEAEMRRVSRITGVDYQSAVGNEAHVKAQAQVEMLDPNGLIRTAPKTANWLATPDNAAVAHDDLPTLQSVEQTLKNLGGIARGSAYALGETTFDAAQAVNEFIDPFGELGLAQRRTLDLTTRKFTATGPQTAVQALGATMRKDAQAAMPTTENWMQAGVNSGIASLLQNAPGVMLSLATRNPELGLALMAGQTGLQSYGEARDAGVDPAGALGHGAKQGAIEGLTEMLPMHALLSDLKAGSGVVKTWMHQLATDVPGEITATVLQNYNDWADLHPEKPFTDYLAQLPADIGTTIIATAMGTAGHTAMEQVAHAVGQHVERQAPEQAKVQQAQQTQVQLDSLMKAAQASALRERDPQTFHDYVAAVTQDAPVDRVYINAQDLVDSLHQGDPAKLAEDAQVLQAMPSVIPQLDEALKSGGLVEIPVSELLAYTPETHLGQAIMEHLKTDPEGFSPKEAEEFLQTQSAGLREEVQKIVQDKGLADEFQASADRVHAQIKGQLDQVGRYTTDVNDVLAMLPTRFYATMAARTGLTPEQFAEQHQLHTQAQGLTDGSLTQGGPFDFQPSGEGQSSGSRELQLGDTTITYGVPKDAAGAIEVSLVRTPAAKRGQGSARAAMQALVQQADAEGRRVVLTAQPMDKKTSKTKLEAFYKSLGFVPNKGRSKDFSTQAGMIREPQVLEQRAPSLTTAIRHGGRLYKADTHMNALAQIEDPKERQRATLDGDNRVFVTERGKVLDRFKAADYAASFGLYRKDLNVPRGAKRGPELISEDLEPYGNGSFYQGYEPGLGFQSTLFKTVLEAKQAKASADQWLAMIQNTAGVKKEEVEWIGLPEALKLMGLEGAITREQVLTYIAQNGVRLEEVVQGDADPERLQELTYESFDREVEERAAEYVDGPEEDEETGDEFWTVLGERFDYFGDAVEAAEEHVRDGVNLAEHEQYARERIGGGPQFAEYQAIPGGENYRELLVIMPTRYDAPDIGGVGYVNPRLKRDFTAGMGHWNHDNVLAHTRLADFTTPDGERVLGVLEIQSDWHQKGRDQGYQTASTEAERQQAQADYDASTVRWNAAALNLVSTAYDLDLTPVIAFGRAFDALGEHDKWRAAENALNDAYLKADLHAKVLDRIDATLREWHDAGLRRSEAAQRVSQLARSIPDAPFKATWPALVMKRIIREAIEKGYDHVAWATGEQQADLYDMRHFVGDIQAYRQEDGRVLVAISNGRRDAREALQQMGEPGDVNAGHGGDAVMTRDQIVSAFGAELGGHLFDTAMETGHARHGGDDVQIGGEGHKAFYNRNLVNITNDIIKKFGAKVGVVDVRNQGGVSGEVALTAQGVPQLQIAERWHAMSQEERDQAIDAARTTKQWGFPITEKMRTEDKAVQPPLFQAGEQPKGAYNPSTNTITLLRNADLSTYLHELGHFFLETTARVAASDTAPAELKADWEAAAGFMGFGGIGPAAWLALPIEARREGHEKWARAFEAYLREGRAPTPQLKGPFQRFKAWLVHVYQDAKQLNVELTDEVRGVFDRLLATQDEIAQAQASRGFMPVFETKPEGMADLEWEAYQRLGAEATADAEDALGSRSIRDMRWLQNTRARIIRQLGREAADKRKALRAEVEAEVSAEPVYAAQQFLKRGSGEEGDTSPHKLSLPDLRTLYGEAPTGVEEATGQKRLEVDYRKLGYGKYGMLAEEGLSPDHVAELFGFSSGDHLVRALLGAEPMREKVEGITDQRMLERYGDLSDPQAIAQAADEAIHNDARLRFVATEANALAKAAGSLKIMASAARDFAAEMVGRTAIRDLKPAKYTGAEARAARAAAKAAAKGDLTLAAMEKRNQLINGYAAKAAFGAQQEVEKALRLFDRLQGVGARKSLDPTYRDQIDQLLERFDLRKGQSLRAIDKRASLVKWVEQMKANQLEPAISEDLLNEAYRKHYKDLTLDELRGLVDTVRTIAHLGRLKNRLLAARDARTFAATIEDATQEVTENAIGKPRTDLESNQVGDKIEKAARGWFVIHRKFDSLVKRLAGLKDSSTLWNVLVRPKNTAGDREASMLDANARKLAEVFRPIMADKFRQKLFIPAISNSLSLEGRLAVALNWGNDINRKRVMDGHGWTPAQVEAILGTLEPRHFVFVQALWDHINSFRPEIEAKEMRVYGVVPPMEEAAPFTATAADGSSVDMRGGYYPISYDPDKSAKAADFDAIRQAKQAIVGAARGYSKPGHLKARVDEVTGRPIKLQLGVAFQHLNDVIHDLSWHEYLIDARRLLGNDTLANAIRVHAGPEILGELKRSVDAMEVGDVPAQNGFERSVNYLRSGATTAGLAWSFMTALQQPLGLLNGTARIGPKWMGVAFKRLGGDAVTAQNTVAWVHGKSEFMRLRAGATTLSREIHDVRGGIRQNFTNDVLKGIMPGESAVKVAKGLDAVEASFYGFIGKMQMLADVPTWLGQYEKSLSVQDDEDFAIRQADQAVRDSQGGGQIGDLAAIQRGGPLMKLWTNFYSYFNVIYNQLAESVEETQLKGVSNVPALAADVMLLLVLPSMLGNLLKKAVGGDWEDWPAELAKGLLGDLFGLMIGMRDIGAAVMDGKDTPAGMRILANTAKLSAKVKAGHFDEGFWKALNSEAGILFHYPAAQVQRTLLGMAAIANGQTHNPLVLATGPARKAQ